VLEAAAAMLEGNCASHAWGGKTSEFWPADGAAAAAAAGAQALAEALVAAAGEQAGRRGAAGAAAAGGAMLRTRDGQLIRLRAAERAADGAAPRVPAPAEALEAARLLRRRGRGADGGLWDHRRERLERYHHYAYGGDRFGVRPGDDGGDEELRMLMQLDDPYA